MTMKLDNIGWHTNEQQKKNPQIDITGPVTPIEKRRPDFTMP
jgi:hypothetical protein